MAMVPSGRELASNFLVRDTNDTYRGYLGISRSWEITKKDIGTYRKRDGHPHCQS